MSEELPREEGLPEASEASDWWIWNLFSARTDEATPREATVRVCATCRRSLDKLNFSRTQWNKKRVGVSRCKECVVAAELSRVESLVETLRLKYDL